MLKGIVFILLPLRYFVPRGTAALPLCFVGAPRGFAPARATPRVAALRALPGVMQMVSLRETAATQNNGERRTANGERGTENGERKTKNGEQPFPVIPNF
jgi:hypothetical protein